jgi:hypothetical protein
MISFICLNNFIKKYYEIFLGRVNGQGSCQRLQAQGDGKYMTLLPKVDTQKEHIFSQ